MRLLLALLAGLALPAAAQPAPGDRAAWDQTAKGVTILGGSASVVRVGSSTSAVLSPRVGRFVADGLALSTRLTLAYSRAVSERAGTSSSTQLGVGPMVTYVFGDGPVRPFAEADLAVTYVRSTNDLRQALGDGPDSNLTIGGGLAAGVELPIARNVALRGQAFYRTSNLSFDSPFEFYGVSAGFSTFIY